MYSLVTTRDVNFENLPNHCFRDYDEKIMEEWEEECRK